MFTLTDGVQIVKGRHQITFGAWFQRIRDNENTASRRARVGHFRQPDDVSAGYRQRHFQVLPDPTALGWRSWFGAWYAEDVIKLRSNLTLRAGIRHEFTNGWNEAFGRASNYVTGSNGILETAPVVGNSVFSQNNATKMFSPRVALAWDPFGNGKTAVRAGFGTSYSLIDNLSFLLNMMPPYNAAAHAFGRAVEHRSPFRRPRRCRYRADRACRRLARRLLRKAFNPTQRRPPCSSGTSPSSKA